MKILIIQTAFIGDVILATPLIEKLRRFYPEAVLDFLLRAGNQGLLAEHPQLRKVWVWEKQREKYTGLFRLLRHIRAERYDVVINCQRFAASGLLTVFSGAKEKVGFDKNPLSAFFTRKITHQIGNGLHETERNLLLINHLSDQSGEKPRLYPTAKDRQKAAQYQPDAPYVSMAPTSVWPTKQWPEHRWVELIGKMPPQLPILLLGGPDDAAACARIVAAAQRENVQNLCGKLGLLASAALMEGAVMNYVNDSAPMHLASAMNAPVTAIFCSTLPSFGFGPLSDNRQVIETQRQLPCRPCGLHGKKNCPLGHFDCAETITLDQFDRAEKNVHNRSGIP